jgi:translation initiation factor IF-3
VRAAASLFWRNTGIAAPRKNRVNHDIKSESVRLIDAEGGQMGIVSIDEALNAAQETGFDLVEISPNAEPPVCRLMDYGKFLFQQNKKRQASKKRQQVIHLKEVKFRPGTEEADYQTKLRNLKRFLNHGDKTKVTLWFRGREMRHQELGMKLLQRVEADLEELAKVEQFPKMEGRRLSMVLTPRK